MNMHRQRDDRGGRRGARKRHSAGRSLPLGVILLSLVGLLSACATDRAHDNVRALTDAFFNALRSGNAREAESLVLQSGGPIWPLITSVSEQTSEIPSYTIEGIHEIDSNDFRVIVVVPRKGSTTTITLIARRHGKVWRFDPDIRVESRFNGVTSHNGGNPVPMG